MKSGIPALLSLLVMSTGVQGVQPGDKQGKANRLINAKSPYLLQHAYNPVDWYPWGEEAFEKARAENKMILLSVGYSTCHWCHVMERESFQDKKVAEFLNKHFVSVKLDREERPDVDKVYMTSFQAMFGEGGGWPLNMFLTPDLKPFFGGTYFPPEDGQRPSFMTVLTRINELWADDSAGILAKASDIHQKLGEHLEKIQQLKPEASFSAELLDGLAEKFLARADQVNGGWGQRQKFPQPSHLLYLLGSVGAGQDFALMTCRKMMEGGINDQIGGGFHRYTVDPVWLVPHFEKMLYDQAQLLDVYVRAWQLTQDSQFRETAVAIAEYVIEQLTHPDGGFYSAQDAQSEGKEGKFWCWTEKELKSLLTDTEFPIARKWFGFTDTGNFVDHSDPDHLKNQNVLFRADPEGEWTALQKEVLSSAIAKMKATRRKRVPPSTDDKILASWNGLMIGAMARAGRILQEPRYLEASRRAHAFIVAKLWDGESMTLSHRWRDNHVDGSQQSESYLYFLRGSRLLYEATLDADYLSLAIDLAAKARTLFYDEENGGFFDGEKRGDLVFRLKDDYDSATPTPSSVARLEYAILAEITGRKDFRDVADKSLRLVAPVLKETPTQLAESLQALQFMVGKPARVAIVGGSSQEEFLKVAWSGLRQNLVVTGNTGPVSEFTRKLEEKFPGKTTVYYCVGKSCRLPETDSSVLSGWLKEDRTAGGTSGARRETRGDPPAQEQGDLP